MRTGDPVYKNYLCPLAPSRKRTHGKCTQKNCTEFEKPIADQVLKRWLIVRKPREIPCTTLPLQNTHEGMIDLLREVIALYPDAQLTVAELAYGNNLWVSDGQEVMQTWEIMMSDKDGDPGP
jgi:hypothetical protein